MTPVMLAAGQGHTGVGDMLVHKYNCSLAEVTTVSAFYCYELSISCRCRLSHVSVSVQLLVLNVTLHVVSICVGCMYVADVLLVPSTVE